MSKRLLAILMCMVLALTMAGCSNAKEEKEKAEKALQEKAEQLDEAAANAFVSAVEALPENIKLKDETLVAGARALYDELSVAQKKLVPAEMLAKLEEAEKKIEEHRAIKEQRDAEKIANKEAAAKAEEVINGIPSNVTLDAENAVNQARAEYNQLTDDQKKYVKKSALDKLTSAESKIKELKEEAKKKEEEKKKKKEEAKKKKAEKKKAEEEKKKKEEKKQDKYAIAKKYVGKKASALIKAIGKPNKKKKNPNCATDGEEYIYYYDGFYVGVLSQDMNSPLIVQNVTKN